MIYNYTYSNDLYHSGVKGQEWGKRRWQNKDGSLTSEGYVHYYGHERPKDSTDRNIDRIKHPIATAKIAAGKASHAIKQTAKASVKLAKKADKSYDAAVEKSRERTMKRLAYEKEKQEAQNELTRKEVEEDKILNDAEREERRANKEFEQEDKAEAAKEVAQLNGEKAWRDWTNEELQAYTTRKNLEAAANKVRFDQLQKPIQYANMAINYANTGISLIDTYQNLVKSYNSLANPKKYIDAQQLNQGQMPQVPQEPSEAQKLVGIFAKSSIENLSNMDFSNPGKTKQFVSDVNDTISGVLKTGKTVDEYWNEKAAEEFKNRKNEGNDSKDDKPQNNAPQNQAPKNEQPKNNAPQNNTPKPEQPKNEAPKDNAPKESSHSGWGTPKMKKGKFKGVTFADGTFVPASQLTPQERQKYKEMAEESKRNGK